jgi:beta-lactamase regulating signal transducer with metallopeptidase domain
MSPVTALLPVLGLIGLMIKVTLVLAAGAALAVLLRRQAAAARHQVWALTLLGVLALAPLVTLAPSIPLPLLARDQDSAAPAPARPSSPVAAPAETTVSSAVDDQAPVRTASAEPRTGTAGFSLPALLLALWALGTAVMVLRSVVGHVALRRLARAATVLDGGDWPALLAQTRTVAAVRPQVRLLRSDEVATPLTWGTLHPVVVLPAVAESWPQEQRRAALLHELAHVGRRDALVQLGGRAACALYWFHPGVWMALRSLRREGERACDDRVLSTGTPAGEYATQLLEVARSARALRVGGSSLAIGMARPSTLEGRLLAVLDETVPRRAPARAARLAGALAMAAALVPLAGLTAVARGTLVAQPKPVAAAAFARRRPGAGGNAGARVPDRGGRLHGVRARRAPGETLELDLETGGSVTIQGWDQSRVELRGHLKSNDLPGMHAEMTRTSGGIRLRSWYTGSSRSQSSSHRFELSVPRRFDVRLDSAGGDLSIEGVEGSFEGTTGGGDLVLQDLRGSARLSTGGGTIRVADAHLEGAVSTGGGKVTLSHVSGGLRGSSGSGPVVYAEPENEGDPTGDVDEHGAARGGGRVHMERAGGDIQLEEAPSGAAVSTGGGDIVVGRAGGSVEASTGGGSIRLGPVAGDVRAATGAGDVEVTVIDAGGEPQSVVVTSGHGRVVIDVPAGFDGRVELETAYTRNVDPTRIEAPWPLERSTSDWSDREGTPRRHVRATGTVGSGQGLLKVKTVNGDVIVRMGGARSSMPW